MDGGERAPVSLDKPTAAQSCQGPREAGRGWKEPSLGGVGGGGGVPALGLSQIHLRWASH